MSQDTAAATPSAPPATEVVVLEARQQVAWPTGNYAVVGTTLQIVGEQLCESMDLRSGSTVLDELVLSLRRASACGCRTCGGGARSR